MTLECRITPGLSVPQIEHCRGDCGVNPSITASRCCVRRLHIIKEATKAMAYWTYVSEAELNKNVHNSIVPCLEGLDLPHNLQRAHSCNSKSWWYTGSSPMWLSFILVQNCFDPCPKRWHLPLGLIICQRLYKYAVFARDLWSSHRSTRRTKLKTSGRGSSVALEHLSLLFDDSLLTVPGLAGIELPGTF